MSDTYIRRRSEIETYFDRTAAAAWARLTSDAPVSGVRATVRAGRDRMRAVLLDMLPANLSGLRVLDAGCGTGALAFEAARRGAHVVAVDLSPKLVELARQRLPREIRDAAIQFRSGDMLDPALGRFDHVVAMDSLIHYRRHDMVAMIGGLAARAERSVLFTYPPRTFLLAAMHAAGKLFPRADRSPRIEPQSGRRLLAAIADEASLSGWHAGESVAVASGFYISTAQELVRA